MAKSYSVGLDVPGTPMELAEFRLKHIDHAGKVIPLHISIGGLKDNCSEPPISQIARLNLVCSIVKPIQIDLVCTCSFPSTSVLWLAPTPVGELEDLYDVLADAFIYERHWRYPTFHATIALGHGNEGMIAAEQEFKKEFSHLLPWSIQFDALSIWVQENGEYSKFGEVPFGG